MKIKSIKIFTFLLVLAMVVIGVGCQRAQRPIPNNGQGTPGQTTRYGTPGTPVNPNTPNRITTPGAPGTDLGRLGTPGATDQMDFTGRYNNMNTPGYDYNNNRIGLNDRDSLIGNLDNNTNNKNNNNITRVTTDANRTAQNIANKLTAMKSIENATVVISGNTALVGIDTVDNDYKNDEEKYLKDDVARMVKNMAPGITKVAVTESPDMYERITNLSRDMRNGRVIQGLSDEFTELVNRITPSVK